MTKATVDRIEGDSAVIILRDAKNLQLNLPLQILPKLVEGDIIDISITKDEEATGDAKKKVLAKINTLKNKG